MNINPSYESVLGLVYSSSLAVTHVRSLEIVLKKISDTAMDDNVTIDVLQVSLVCNGKGRKYNIFKTEMKVVTDYKNQLHRFYTVCLLMQK